MGKIFDALEKANKNSSTTATSMVNTKVSSREKIERKSKNNVVPLYKPGTKVPAEGFDSNLIVYHSPNSIEAEVFKVLRTNLLFSVEKKPPRTILVTSAIPGDGKSFVSANLAISIAQGVDEHALLLDSDIRNPSIDTMFGMGKVAGLSEYLANESDISKMLVRTAVDKLTILPAGKPPHNPTELLTTQKMKTLLREVADRYDDRYIIIDSAPPSLASETGAISNYVDGIIIVVRAGKTPRNAVAEVISQLGKEKIIGVVLNYSHQSIKKYYGYGKPYYQNVPSTG